MIRKLTIFLEDKKSFLSSMPSGIKRHDLESFQQEEFNTKTSCKHIIFIFIY